jgi:hypothetical protein
LLVTEERSKVDARPTAHRLGAVLAYYLWVISRRDGGTSMGTKGIDVYEIQFNGIRSMRLGVTKQIHPLEVVECLKVLEGAFKLRHLPCS